MMSDHSVQEKEGRRPLTPEECQKVLDELERLGLAMRTGEYRDGFPVYVATEYWRGRA